MKVNLIGVGLGNPDTMTVAARQAAEDCTVLIGAKRLLEGWPGKPGIAAIAAADIAAAIAAQETGPVGVVLSGDVGFYSGAKNLYPLLAGYEVAVFPGLSSLAYFCARLHTPWEDVHPASAHGRALNAAGEIQSHKRTFLLTGGKTKAEDICKELCQRGLGGIRVSVGEKLSYPAERIVTGTAAELSAMRFDDLSVLLAENPAPIVRPCNAPGLHDGLFARGEVPMTKEEVRTLAVCKLRLKPDHVLWDVGAGTGSVSVEGAYAVPAGRVFAIERKDEAVALLRANKAKFGLTNLEIIPGEAPAALAELPAPDRVFIGGTAGRMEDIIGLALDKNPAVRLVLTCVTVETIAEALRCFQTLALGEPDIVQIAATRTRKAGPYHLMDAQNPVWIVSGEGKG